jgi:hypothetical protein
VLQRHNLLRIVEARCKFVSLQWILKPRWGVQMAENPDFDTLRNLAEQDPKGYFAERARLIEAFFETVPADRREQLRGFQAEIDALRASAGTPANAVENLMGMLSEHLEALLGHTVQLAQEARQLRAATPPPART